MLNSKKIKTLLITACLSFVFVVPVQAATYNVTSGDSLYKIATLFQDSADTIRSSNNLSSSTIYPGQVLNIKANIASDFSRSSSTLPKPLNKKGETR